MTGVPLARCLACGQVVFPLPSLCPRCGAAAWQAEYAREAVVEEVTWRDVRPPAGDADGEPTPVFLASVRTSAGPRLTVRCGAGTRRGDRVTLATEWTAASGHPPGRLVARGPPGARG